MPKKNGLNVTAKDLMAMLERQEFKCALTGRELTPEVATLDHRTPLSKGGSHTVDNIWIVHEDVNRAKGSLTAEDFISLCRSVAAIHCLEAHTDSKEQESAA